MKKILILLALMIMALVPAANAAEPSAKPIYFNDELMTFANPILSENGCIIVPIRELSEKAGFTVSWDGTERRVLAENKMMAVTMFIGNTNIQTMNRVGRYMEVEAILPPTIINSVTYVPIRVVSEAFGAEVIWDPKTDTVNIYMEVTEPDWNDGQVNTESEENTREEENNWENEQPYWEYEQPSRGYDDMGWGYEEPAEEEIVDVYPLPAAVWPMAGCSFYSQYDPNYIASFSGEPYRWTAGRNGYCYASSYAMLLSNITGLTINPREIADINLENGDNASVCHHAAIVERYNCRLVQAISNSSPYFKEYDSGRGLTMIDNSTPQAVEMAIKTALAAHPKGVLVRDTTMPHTMVAIGYDENGIYFNDPALSRGNVRWKETCLKGKDLTTIVAIAAIKQN